MSGAKSIISEFPSPGDLAAEIGLPVATVWKWGQRGRIPAEYDVSIVQAARRLGVNVTFERLAEARAAGMAAE